MRDINVEVGNTTRHRDAHRRSAAGAAGYFFAADQIRANDFDRSVRLITQDDDAYWCGQADGQVINSKAGSKFCAIHMPKYVEQEEPTE